MKFIIWIDPDRRRKPRDGSWITEWLWHDGFAELLAPISNDMRRTEDKRFWQA